jgi:glycosyltransferase involved in cell wall biosynthesis
MDGKNTNRREIRICALMLDPYDTMPGQRFRLEQWEPYLKDEGIVIDYFPFSDEKLRNVIYRPGHFAAKAAGMMRATMRRLNQIFKASKYDAVYLYRTASMIGPAWLEKLLSKQKVPIIFDFDDAIFLPNTSKANERFGWLKFAEKTADICRLSTCVVVGNSYLADYAKKYNDNFHIIPTSIDTNKYQPSRSKENGKIILGWTGSSTSQYHLESFEPTLEKIIKDLDVELRVISDRPPDFKTLSCNWQAWSAEKEVEITSQFDIGIMPIPDDAWSKGKCAAKALQYMALETPAVCSDVGANREVIEQGVNGFLAESEEEWANALEILVKDDSLRKKMGVEARKTVVERYSMTKCAKLFAEVVRNNLEL